MEDKIQAEKEMVKEPMGNQAKPIQSPVFAPVIQTAFYYEVINEYKLCKTHDKIDTLFFSRLFQIRSKFTTEVSQL